MRQSILVCYVALFAVLFSCGNVSDTTETSSVLSCPALDKCHVDGVYSTRTQQCSHPSKADGAPCASATACEGARLCENGVCSPGEAVVCPGTEGCNLATCDPNAGCAVVSLTGPCNPGMLPITLQGCTSGDYSAAVTLGNDQIFDMIIDSGSSTIAVAGSRCTNCNTITPRYSPGTTATNERVRATGAYGAASGWTGTVYNDMVTLGSDEANTLSIDFVSIEEQTTQSTDTDTMAMTTTFFTQSYCSGTATANTFQGIFGLANSRLNAPHTSNYLDALKATNTIADAFSTQFCDSGGNLWLGGYNPNALLAAPNYTPMDGASGYYTVELQDILFGDASLGLAASAYGAAVVDTGTSVVVVADAVMQALISVADSSTAFRSYFGPGFLGGNDCEAPADRPTKAQLDAALPTMTWVFQRADGTSFDVVMPATESYLTPQLLQSGVLGYCSGFLNGGSSSSPTTIIGNSAMHSQILIFDRANGQLGFAPQRGCP